MRASDSFSGGLSSSGSSLAGLSTTSSSMRAPTSWLLRSMLSRASRFAGSVASRNAVMKEAELAGGGAERDHAVAAIEQAAGGREAAERFHQRVGAVGDPRHLVGVALDHADVLVDAPLHRLLQRERLHGADALQRFLHRLHDVGGAGELVVGQP